MEQLAVSSLYKILSNIYTDYILLTVFLAANGLMENFR